MTCPKCGLEIVADQKFCRSCGARLELITQQLAQSQAVSDLESRGPNRRTNNFMLWGFIALLIGAAIGVIGKKLLHDDITSVTGVLLSLVGLFLMVYPHLVPSRRKENDSILASQPEALTSSQPSKYLPEHESVEYHPSVAERTTDLLEHVPAKRRNAETKRTL